MPLHERVSLVLFGLTALNWTIHWYTHMVTYRLFPEVARHMSGVGFVAYHRAYQARLPWAIYLPWSLMMVASVAAVILSPPGERPAAFLLLVANAAIGVISFVLAVPVHSRIDRRRRLLEADGAALMKANLYRVVAASVSLAVSGALTFAH